MFRRFLSLIAIAFLVMPLEGQSRWGPSGCAPVGAREKPVIGQVPSAEPIEALNDGTSGWFEFSTPGYVGWYRNNVLIGRWHRESKTWQEWDGRKWLPASNPPWFVQPMTMPGAKVEYDGSINFGLDRDKLASTEKFYVGDSEVSRNEFDAVIGDPAKDDSRLPQVVVLDTNANRRKEAFDTLTTRLAGKARVSAADPLNKDQQAFLEGFKLNQDERFKKDNYATFVLGPRDKDGLAQVRHAIYAAKPALALADDVGIRVDPNYKPENNPTGGSAAKFDWSWLSQAIWYIITALLGGGLGYRAAQVKPTVTQVSGNNLPASTSDLLVNALKAWQADQNARDEEAKQRAAEAVEIKKALLEVAGQLGK